MNLAENYLVIGNELGVFEKLAPRGAYELSNIYRDSRFSGFKGIILPNLLPHEQKYLDQYISNSTIKRKKKKPQT